MDEENRCSSLNLLDGDKDTVIIETVLYKEEGQMMIQDITDCWHKYYTGTAPAAKKIQIDIVFRSGMARGSVKPL